MGFLSTEWARVKRFISAVAYKTNHWKTVITHDYGLYEKLKWLFIETIDVLVTGTLAWLAIEHLNSTHLLLRILSYGLVAALGTYYFEFIVNTIRGKPKQRSDDKS